MSITADRPATIAADPCTLVSAEVFNKITRYFATTQDQVTQPGGSMAARTQNQPRCSQSAPM
ncbi:hypothetical protein DKT68_06855 [Micromonospora acroterricola]|uniref:Uncharacterized protein n=1 Tax=Micromonospora acroterricola TaxID=2202421 RepID=A0A317DBS6_9ACTN|nr:hypothetical protein DKT68_06855 [Micromonospora acroterricola]